MKRALRVTHCALTDVGRSRAQNEDGVVALTFQAATCAEPTSVSLFAVSDGMGGHNAGEIASTVALRGLVNSLHKSFFLPLIQSGPFQLPNRAYNYHFQPDSSKGRPISLPAALKRAVTRANAEVINLSRKNPAFFGMGATLTAALLRDNHLCIGSIGDSRAYLYHAAEFRQLTRDHTIVNQMLDLGTISNAEARRHPARHFLYRSLGSDEQLEMDLFELDLLPPCTLLLCSDGLNGMVEDAALAAILQRTRTPHVAARQFVRLANRAGGRDNISVIVLQLATI